MLYLVLIEQTDTEVVYNYYPERDEAHGTIIINKGTGDIISIEKASNDKFGAYLGNAIARLRKYAASRCYLERDIVAWF